jgi:exosome complex exonuclease RRP6
MFYYARSDTHYLLYVYDQMRNELNQASNPETPEENYMKHVLERSKETSLRRHEKFIYDAETGEGAFGWFNMLMKQSSGNFSREQFAVFRAVHKWRDDLARQEDESPVFIMGNSVIFDIARRLPPDPKALHSLVSQASYPVKQRISELFKVVAKAKEDGAKGPTLSEFFGRSAGSSGHGVGAVAQQVFPRLKSTESILDTKELVSETSRLWGEVPVSSRWEADSGANSAAKHMEFALPWATFVEHASVSDTQSFTKRAAARAPAPEEDFISADPADDSFTLKQGTKRKAPETPAEQEPEEGEADVAQPKKSSALDDDEISVLSSSEEEERERARRKAAKNERKLRKQAEKAAKAAAKGEEEGEEEEEEEEPFDYSKANSVLKARRDGGDSSKGGKGRVFNPYSSLSAEGPKPARRMHGEKVGKSATFKKV